MEALQRTSYAKEHELIKFEIKKGEVLKFTIHRLKIRKVTRKKSKSRKMEPKVNIEREEKLFLEAEAFNGIPDEEIHQIPEEHYPIINEKVKEFSEHLYFVVGEEAEGRYENNHTRGEIKKNDDYAESGPSNLKGDQLPMKNKRSDTHQELTVGKNDAYMKKYDDLRTIVWRLNWCLGQGLKC